MAEPKRILVDLKTLKQWTCEMCNKPYFTWVYEIRIIPRLLTGDQQDIDQSIAHRKCDSCGSINLNPLVKE